MTFRHFIIFKAVCEEGSFTKAAEALYMTQPAVSHAINELETELNILLFERIAKKIYLTEQGKIFLQKTLHLLETYEDMKTGIKQTEIRLGSSITIANYWLPEIIQNFYRKEKNIKIQVTIDTAKRITEKLKKNEIDIALIEGSIKKNSFSLFLFSSYELQFICAREHPLAGKEISMQEVVKEDFLLREKGSAIREVLDSAFLLKGLTIEPVWVSVNSQVLIQAVKKNLGISILPDIMVKEELKKNHLARIKIKDLELKNENYLVYQKEKYLSEGLKSFIQMIKENRNET